jgi:phosphoglycerate-specific signal transduction histidine kinase
MLDGIYNEQIQFYRQKNQELEERVDDHIRVNKDLKDHIASLIRNHADPHSL